MKRVFLFFAFVAALATMQVLLYLTVPMLPEQIASKFGYGGTVNDYMSRDVYQIFFHLLSLFMPLFVVFMLGVLPRGKPSSINMPNRDYWLGPERRAATLGMLLDHSLVFGILLTAFLAVLHLLMIEANRHQPPRMNSAYFLPALGLYLLCIGLWSFSLVRSFRRPDAASRR